MPTIANEKISFEVKFVQIRLLAALGGEQDYYNKKGYPSIQLQVYITCRLQIKMFNTLKRSQCTEVKRM